MALRRFSRENSHERRQYRYAGVHDTFSGHLQLISVGTFGGFDAAMITINSTQYLIGLADSKTLGMMSLHDGTPITNWYTASAPGAACV